MIDKLKSGTLQDIAEVIKGGVKDEKEYRDVIIACVSHGHVSLLEGLEKMGIKHNTIWGFYTPLKITINPSFFPDLLVIASANLQKEVISWLLFHDYQTNWQDSLAFLTALRQGHLDLACDLVYFGADASANHFEALKLHLFNEVEHPRFLKLLRENFPSFMVNQPEGFKNLVIDCIQAKHIGALEKLVKYGFLFCQVDMLVEAMITRDEAIFDFVLAHIVADSRTFFDEAFRMTAQIQHALFQNKLIDYCRLHNDYFVEPLIFTELKDINSIQTVQEQSSKPSCVTSPLEKQRRLV